MLMQSVRCSLGRTRYTNPLDLTRVMRVAFGLCLLLMLFHTPMLGADLSLHAVGTVDVDEASSDQPDESDTGDAPDAPVHAYAIYFPRLSHSDPSNALQYDCFRPPAVV